MDDLFTRIRKAMSRKVLRPGSRHGKYYIDAKGNVIYGERKIGGAQGGLFDEPKAEPKKESRAEKEKRILTEIQKRAAEKKDRERLAELEAKARAETIKKQPKKEPAKKTEKKEPAANAQEFYAEVVGYIKKFRNEPVSADEFKKMFETTLAGKDDILEFLNSKTKTLLLSKIGSFMRHRYRNEKKSEIVRAIYDDIISGFNLSDTLTYGFSESFEDALKRKVAQTTNSDLEKYRINYQQKQVQYQQNVENRKKEIDRIKAAIENPKTLEDFELLIKYKGKNKMTPEQVERYDELKTGSIKNQKQAQEEKKSIVEKVDVDTGMKIIPGKHTKKGHDIWTVQLQDRVERDKYLELNAKAKKLGGYYSSYRGGGATPGFVFTDEKAANDFVGLKEKSADIGSRIEEKKEKKVNTSVERMKKLADSIEESANESLNQDRLANTARRARMAGQAENAARSNIAFAKTFRKIAEAIERGEAKHLEKMTSMVQLQELYRGIHRIVKYEKAQRLEPKREDISKLTLPKYSLIGHVMGSMVNTLLEAGAKQTAIQLNARYRKTRRDGQYNFTSNADIALIEKVVKQLGDNAWQLKSTYDELSRLKRMGIETDEQYRSAVRELFDIQERKEQESPIKKRERELIGKKIPGYFPTPQPIVNTMLDYANIKPGMSVLEPSAGKGNIADAIRENHPDSQMQVIEFDSTLNELLKLKGHNVSDDYNFLEHSGQYDRIVMNPPFEKFQDVDHVQHAYDQLAPGGRLVAIMSESPFFRQDKKAAEFRDWLNGRGYSEKNPDKAFMSSERPTGVATRIVVIDKP